MTPLISYSILFLSALTFFAVIDSIWIFGVAKQFYRSAIGHLMGERMRLGGGILFYLIFIAGLTFFALLPALWTNSRLGATLLGGLYGLFTYATYDLTNYVTLRDWPLRLVIVDMCWGVGLSAGTALFAYSIGTLIL